MIRGCHGGTLDHYFFLYFAINNSILVLFLSTYLRRKVLTSTAPPTENNSISGPRFIITYLLPFFLISTIFAITTIIVQDNIHPGEIRLEAAATNASPLMIVVIAMNVHLSYFLNERKKISEKLNERSFRNLATARRVLISLAKWQTFYVGIWIVLIIVKFAAVFNDAVGHVVLLWITRFVFCLCFVLEAKIMVSKDKILRRFLGNKIKMVCFCCGDGGGGGNNGSDNIADRTSQASKQSKITTSSTLQ